MSETVVTPEMQKELALVVGFTFKEGEQEKIGEYVKWHWCQGCWIYPDGTKWGALPDLTDLTNGDKWLAPMLDFYILLQTKTGTIARVQKGMTKGYAEQEHAGTALFLACWKLLVESEG